MKEKIKKLKWHKKDRKLKAQICYKTKSSFK